MRHTRRLPLTLRRMEAPAEAQGRRSEIEFFHDYVDPASYLVDRILRASAGDAGVGPIPRPFEIRRPAAGMLNARHPDWIRYLDAMRQRAREIEVPFHPPALVPLSRKAHELALLAREKGRFPAVHAALYRAHFEGGLDIGRVDVLVSVAEKSGMDTTESKAALDVDRFHEAVDEERARAERLGVRGVPTLRAGDARLEGFHPRDEILTFLRHVAERS